jgi:metallophosphoesterase (TIGR03768 family)
MKNSKGIRIYLLLVIVFVLALLFVLIFYNPFKKNNSTQQTSYPIDSTVATTLERTIVPIDVPSTSSKLLPADIAIFAQNGYGVWQFGQGLAYEKRLDLMADGYTDTSATNTASLLNFFTMSDIHLTDEESPAQSVYYGSKWGVISGYSPAMLYTTQTLDATVQTINVLNKRTPFDFGISLGDNINSDQYNELRWFIDTLDGKNINPDSGVKDDPIPGPNNDYQDTFKAAGLDKTIPWYQTLGNHDHFWMGLFTPDDYIKNTLVGNTILNQSNIFSADGIKAGINGRGYYMGAVDGSTPNGDIVGAGPVADFSSPPTVPADLNRRFLSTNSWMSEFFNSSSSPIGHGFSQADVASGFANYTFEPKSDVPLKVIVLDDTENNNDPSDKTNGHGSLDQKRYDWLTAELDKGQAEGKLMIIAAHIPIGVKLDSSGLGASLTWSEHAAVTDTDLIAKLHTYPNIIAWISGHRHRNTVTALKSPDPNHPELGFWEIETPSLREFPQQFRTFQIVRNTDNNISIFATDVDPAVKDGSLAANARSNAIAADQIFNIPKESLFSYNAELIKQLTPEMQTKIQNYGTPISK